MTPTDVPAGRRLRRIPGAVVLVAVLALVVFAPVLTHDFLSWDDTTFVTGDPAVARPTLASLGVIWTRVGTVLYVPVPYTVWWAIACVGSVDDGTGHPALNPYLFHAANWLAHAGVAGLTVLLLRRLRFGNTAALLGAAATTVHPLAVETVAWTLGLRDLLATAAGLATVLLVLSDRRWAAAGLMLVAVLCKPTAITTWPAAVAVVWFLRSTREDPLTPASERNEDPGSSVSSSEPGSWLRSVPDIRRITSTIRVTCYLLPVVILGVVLAGVKAQGIHPDISVVWQRPLVAADAVAFYLGKLAWPWPLAFDYARTPAAIFASGAAEWTWLAPAAGLGLLVWLRSRTAWLAAALFVLPLGPVLGLVPFGFESLSTVADHYAYPSLAGLAVGVAAVVRRWPRATPAVVVLLAVWAGLSVRQERAWADDATFFPFMAAASPDSGPAWDGIARTRLAANDLAGADEAATHGIAVAPDYAFLRLTAVRIKSALHDSVARDRQLDELERIYRKQSNFDPGVFAKVRAALER